MGDQENDKGSNKPIKVQFDSKKNQTHLLDQDLTNASSSSHSSDSSLESTLTDKDDGEIPPTSHHPPFDLEGPTPTDASVAQPSNGHPPGYDPNRIPSSIFNSRANTPMEWSVASNESLFSIHMGNNSFSRDQAFFLYKSGELMKLDEVFSVPNALPPVAEGSTAEQGFSSESKNPFETEPQQSAGDKDAHLESSKVDNDKGKLPPSSPSRNEDVRNSTSVSTHSDGSRTSTGSFAFPVFGGGDLKNLSKKVETPKEEEESSSDQSQEQKHHQPMQEERQRPNKAGFGNWFSCFWCCSFRCSLYNK